MDVGIMNGSIHASSEAYAAKEAKQTKETKAAKENKPTEEVKKYGVSGRTVGQPKLSENAKKYYEELKSKFQNMDFILVSKDMKEMAKANAGSFANPHKMVVLIDEEKIERMATDEQYRKQYEGIIASAGNKLPQLQKTLEKSGKVKAFGMQINDNGAASFFAVMDNAFKSQAKRLEKQRAEKKEEKKEAEKKAEKAKREEQLKEKRLSKNEESETVIYADSFEELKLKVEDYIFEHMADTVKTASERYLGTHIDFKG